MNLEAIDIIYIIIVLVMAFHGFKKGFFSQLFIIVGLVFGLLVAYLFADDLSPTISEIVGEGKWNNMISFIIIFVLFFGICQLLNKAFKSSLESLGAQGIDKIFGFSFGLAQGWIIVTAITFILTMQPIFDPTPIFQDSTIGNKIISLIPDLEKIYPDAKEYIESLDVDISDLNKDI